MKKIWMVALVLILTAAFGALAEETEYSQGDYSYIILENGTAEITAYYGEEEHLVLPSELGGHAVSTTSKEVFAFNDNIRSVSIPYSYTSLGIGAFDECRCLMEFIVPDDHSAFSVIDGVLFSKDQAELVCFPYAMAGDCYSVPDGTTIIGQGAFSHSPLFEIELPDSLESIEEYAFSGCEYLRNIELPDSVRFIGEGAFGYTDIRSLSIPEGVREIYDYTFTWCARLESIELPLSLERIHGNPFSSTENLREIILAPDHPAFEIVNSALIDKNEKRLVLLPLSCSTEEYTIPEGVEIIGDRAFIWHENIRKISIPEGVTTIQDGAFEFCFGIEEISLPESLKTIGHSAFMHCSSLERVTIPDGIEFIDEFAFSCCDKLQEVSLPSESFSLDEYAFIWSEMIQVVRR